MSNPTPQPVLPENDKAISLYTVRVIREPSGRELYLLSDLLKVPEIAAELTRLEAEKEVAVERWKLQAELDGLSGALEGIQEAKTLSKNQLGGREDELIMLIRSVREKIKALFPEQKGSHE